LGKDGSLRNGAPFIAPPEGFKRLQAALLKQLGVDTSPLQPAAFIVGHRRSDGTVASFERHRV